MVSYSDLSGKLHPVAHDHAARNANLGHDDTVAAYDDVVPDVNLAIDLGATADSRLAAGARPGNSAIGANMDVVFDDDAAVVVEQAVLIALPFVAEAVTTDDRPGTDADPRADGRAAEDSRVGSDESARPDLDLGPDEHERRKDDVGRDPGAGCNVGRLRA